MVTIDELEKFLARPENQERRFELINGEIVERVELTMKRGLILGNLSAALHTFTRQNQLSGRAGISIDYCVPGDIYNYRTIDLSFRDTNEPVVTKGCVQGMPDFAIEIKTLDMTIKQLREKSEFYLANGTQLVWLVHPGKRLIEVHTAAGEYIFTESDTISGDDVLPGFTLPVLDVFAGSMA